jgi:hypothetical protein
MESCKWKMMGINWWMDMKEEDWNDGVEELRMIGDEVV